MQIHPRIVQRLPGPREESRALVDHLFIQLAEINMLNAGVFQKFADHTAVPSPDHQHILRFRMGKAGHMDKHLVIDEFIGFRQLDLSVQRQHFAEPLSAEDFKKLIIGLLGCEHLLNADGQRTPRPQRTLFGKIPLLEHLAHRQSPVQAIRNAGWIL